MGKDTCGEVNSYLRGLSKEGAEPRLMTTGVTDHCANNCHAKELVKMNLALLPNKKVLLKTLNELFCFSDTVVDGDSNLL